MSRTKPHLLVGCLMAVGGLLVTGLPRSAFAQSLFGSGGPLSQTGNSSTAGSSLGGSALSGSRSSSGGSTAMFGGNTPGGSALGGQSGLTSGLNNAGLSGSGLAGPQFNTQLGQLSATIGQGFVGRSDTAGRFVGSQTAGQQAILGTSPGGQFGGGQFGGGFDRGQTQDRTSGFNQQQGSGARSTRVVRPRLKIAFEYPERPAAVRTNLTTQFQRIRTTREELSQVQVELGDNQQVTLRGRVASEDDKKLAAMLARLEPGVRSVRNEITVASDN